MKISLKRNIIEHCKYLLSVSVSRKITFAFAFVVFQLSLGMAQEWTLENCIAYAKEHNPELRKLQLNIQKSQIRADATKYDYYPDLNVRLRTGSNFGLYIDPTTNILDYGNNYVNNLQVNSELALFDGFYNKYHKIYRKGELETSTYLLEKEVMALNLDIAHVFFNIALQEEMLLLIQLRLDVLHQQKLFIEKSIEAGLLHKRETLFLAYLIAQDEANMVKSENLIKQHTAFLKSLLGLSHKELFKPITDKQKIVPEISGNNDYENVLSDAFKHFPHLKLGHSLVNNAHNAMQLSRAKLYPTLSLRGVVGTKTSSRNTVKNFSNQLHDNNYQYIGLNLNIPVYNRNVVRTEIALATIDVEAAKISALQLSLELENLIQNAVLALNNAAALYHSMKAKHEAALQSFEFAQRQFEIGEIGVYEFSDITARLIAAENDLLSAKYDYILRSQVINYYRGNK